MIERLLHKIGYTSFYFISYVGQNGLHGSMNMQVKPYINSNNYTRVIKEVSRLAGEEVAVTCISKL